MTLTSTDIRAAMSRRWAAPEWAVMWEVGKATGAVSGRQRYADAVMMSLWPSRGLELHGVEIKVNRHDWRREAADPTKAETIAAYCDRWWVHTPPGIIADGELPPAWGWRTFDGKTWRTVKEAEKTPAQPCDRSFLASLLRRADEVSRADIDRQARALTDGVIRESEARINSEVERRTRNAEAATEALREFEEALGISINTRRQFMAGVDAKKLGALVKMFLAAGLDESWIGLRAIKSAAETTVRRMDMAMKDSPFFEAQDADATGV